VVLWRFQTIDWPDDTLRDLLRCRLSGLWQYAAGCGTATPPNRLGIDPQDRTAGDYQHKTFQNISKNAAKSK
jgi:hypothetical protein